ncbi:PH domain-containing protein [Streptomyces sp. NPDC007905]|uniref:PH domain-containing protein n=1 Tax=Streptomyces sp. NPDC007905 TaxID=3364788 RepID=UPI0036E9BD51
MVLTLGLLGLDGVFRMTQHNSLSPWLPVAVFAFYAVLLARTVLYLRRARTLVGARGVTARRALTERSRAWHDIYDIRAEPVPNALAAARKWITFLYDTDGRRFVLPHLDDWQLDDPPAEVAALREAAARHRGMAWERRPEVEARIRRRAGHRKAWERAFTGGIIAFGCGFLLWVALVIITSHPPTLLLFLWMPLGSFAALAGLLHWRWSPRSPGPCGSRSVLHPASGAPGCGRHGPWVGCGAWAVSRAAQGQRA